MKELNSKQEDLILDNEDIYEEVKCTSCGCEGRFGDENNGFVVCECGESVEVFKWNIKWQQRKK